jgi:hypothetical protein
MFRPPAVASIATIFCLVGAACQALTGSVDVIPPPEGPVPMPGQAMGDDAPIQRPDDADPLPPGNGVVEVPAVNAPLDEGLPPADDGAGAPSDTGSSDMGSAVDAGPPPPADRPVLVHGAAAELERVGEEGGQPHLGICERGVVIGIRPTANPGDAVFGQRVTLVEPLCGTLVLTPGSSGDPASSRVRVVPDDAILTWPVTDILQGPPVTEVPDDRLIWVTQPPTLCPDAAPVLVGLSGEYDPAAPDSTVTSAIRSVVIECAPLMVGPDGIQVSASDLGRQFITRADSFAADGTAEYASSCTGGAVTTQILVHAGFWLDGFVIGCSSLASPHLAGEPCADGAECLSGACGPEATCDP